MVLLQEDVIRATEKWARWWIEERKRKLREHLSESMSINPLMLPVIYEFHTLQNFGGLSELLVGSHLMVGHSTGFGKLIDEKILPNVFGTTKLDKAFRQSTPPYSESNFDEIDHVVPRGNDKPDLLSLKSSRWTIQLTMSVQLNTSFNGIISSHGDDFGKIVVGVIYGKKEDLTDKYDILRGINRGQKHDVVDLTDRVDVFAGREFWSWLNDGKAETQDWVLDGILAAINDKNLREECKSLLENYNRKIKEKYNKFIDGDGTIDWKGLLTEISG